MNCELIFVKEHSFEAKNLLFKFQYLKFGSI